MSVNLGSTGGLRLQKKFEGNFSSGLLIPIKCIRLLWQRRASHFPIETGETAGIAKFFEFRWVLTHGSRDGFGLRK